MMSYSIRVNSIDRESVFNQLSLETGAVLEESNTLIRFSGNIGRGQVKEWHLEAGLYMRVWDLNLARPVEFIKEASPLYITNNGFSLVCVATPASVSLKSINQHQQFNEVRERRLILVPDSENAVFQLSPQMPVQLIEFSISSYWLKQQPGYVSVIRYFNDGVAADHAMPVLIAPFAVKTNSVVARIMAYMQETKKDAAGVVPEASVVIKDFLSAVSRTEPDKTSNHLELYYDKIKEAERILLSNLQQSPPRLAKIAQMLALSESTLKRYFKLIYGKSVYEYYLTRKLEMAKVLLMQHPYTVNEIAELMGYEKVSHFIEIFKKHHGCSPGAIKKNSLLSY
ncbi:helix-turn-helix transcriptional regulator [Longitalea luteola]|uniref:helix-turn-helix transcriptional regulator n=1 Tax=Longitalea luteola TaxID=2812563 RepID=UPI001A972DE9|nr:AraC family transcriptional regulator [Longitalea luteola]